MLLKEAIEIDLPLSFFPQEHPITLKINNWSVYRYKVQNNKGDSPYPLLPHGVSNYFQNTVWSGTRRYIEISIFIKQNEHNVCTVTLTKTTWVLLSSYTGWPRNNGTVDTVGCSGLCSNQQLFSSPCWIEHLFPIIITPRSSNLVENSLFYETFLMDCHFRDLPDLQSFEARWQINGKSQKWQSIRNYS